MYPALWDTTCFHNDKVNPVVPNSTAECQTPYAIWLKVGRRRLPAAAAAAGFANAINACKKSGVAFGTSASNSPFISTMNSYWQSKGLDGNTWGKDIIEAARGRVQIPGSSFNFGSVGMDFRKEVIQKGVVYLNVFPYVIWEMQDAINDCIDAPAQTARRATRGGSSAHAWGALPLARPLTPAARRKEQRRQ